MIDGNPVAKRAWWRDPRWIIAGLAIVVVSAGIYGLVGPEPPIVVSRETTYLTGPLAADGLPDYDAAVLALAGPTPAPEDNAAVDLLQVCRTRLGRGDRAALCARLGIAATEPTAVLDLRWPVGDEVIGDTDWALRVSEWPWSTADHFDLAAWLMTHEALLDRIVAAADKPRFWVPTGLLGPSRFHTLDDVVIHTLDEVVSTLQCRAMWHLGEGRPAEAWRNLRAIHRLGRLCDEPQSGVSLRHFVATTARSTAARATATHLLGTPALPAGIVAEIAREFAGTAADDTADGAILYQRLFSLHAVLHIARREPGGRRARPRSPVCRYYGDRDGIDAALVAGLDWNAVLVRLNRFHDAIDAAFRLPSHAARRTEVDRLCAIAAPATPAPAAPGRFPGSFATVFGELVDPGHRAAVVGDWILALHADMFSALLRTGAHGRAWTELVRTAAALAAWRADHGSYPERLEELVPGLCAAVPLDPCTGTPLVYERRGDGYLLASAGPDGVFDGGDDHSGWIINGEWQKTHTNFPFMHSDRVVRVPVPPSPRAASAPP